MYKARSSSQKKHTKSRSWRLKMRRRAEAEHARRKRERGAKQVKLDLRVLAAEARERFFERQLMFAYRHGRAGRLVMRSRGSFTTAALGPPGTGRAQR
jgi:hypothetical protein